MTLILGLEALIPEGTETRLFLWYLLPRPFIFRTLQPPCGAVVPNFTDPTGRASTNQETNQDGKPDPATSGESRGVARV